MVVHKNASRCKVANPLIAGITLFVQRQSLWNLKHDATHEVSHNESPQQDHPTSPPRTLNPCDIPKRYTVYEPMLLLGPNFHIHTVAWQDFYQSLKPDKLQDLFHSIADAFCRSGHRVTHVAVNAPIQAVVDTKDPEQQENVMRSPLNLQPLYGDFGPAVYLSDQQLTSAEMSTALWVDTCQVGGIRQVWAPRWTMFSRGNIREKARILGGQGIFPGLTSIELDGPLSEIDVVDFYVGIGYFAFSYLKRGVRTVFGWDINQWSIEGLRRGCEKNGWHCLVVTVEDDANRRASVAQSVVQRLLASSPPMCVAFCGDNRSAVEIMSYIAEGLRNTEHALNIRHMNLGLLPTSQGAWEGSVRIINNKTGGWLHVHENAEIADVSNKEQQVIGGLRDVLPVERKDWKVSCENIEMVKTYAPGVGHYVFDVKVFPES